LSDFTRFDFLERQNAGREVLLELLETVGRRLENHYGDPAPLQILLVAKVGIDGDQHIKTGFRQFQTVRRSVFQPTRLLEPSEIRGHDLSGNLSALLAHNHRGRRRIVYAPFSLSCSYLQPEQEEQQSAEGQQPACAALAGPATANASTANNKTTFNVFMDFSFRSGKSCRSADEAVRAKNLADCQELIS